MMDHRMSRLMVPLGDPDTEAKVNHHMKRWTDVGWELICADRFQGVNAIDVDFNFYWRPGQRPAEDERQ
jgi:hypothetical protein